MRKISKSTMSVLENDPRMKFCCLRHLGGCSGRIEWHHNLIYAGRQSNVPETILGVCKYHHDQANNKQIKELLDWVMLSLFNPRHFETFGRASLNSKRTYLNKKYGTYNY